MMELNVICLLFTENGAVNARDGISETLNLKNFWGSMPPDSPMFGAPKAR